MARPSVSVPDDLLEDFDDKIWELKVEEEVKRDTTRSDVMQELMRQWVEGNLNLTSARSRAIEASD